MDLQQILFLAIVVIAAISVRLPFLRVPMDEDFSTFTYKARFAGKGFEWKKDIFLFLHPVWRMEVLDLIYGSPEKGVARVRIFLAIQHAVSASVIFLAVQILTDSPYAALISAMLFAIFASVPALEAESINFEQFYVPFLFAGFMFSWLGADYQLYAGICFGLAAISKFTTVIYIPVFMVIGNMEYGGDSLTQFTIGWAAPLAWAVTFDLARGFYDEESLKQIKLRMALTLRCSKLKSMYGSIVEDLKKVFSQTLPVWIFGLPSLAASFGGKLGIWFTAFSAVTVITIICQRGFSRYHYLPFITLLALASGIGIDYVLHANGMIKLFALTVFALSIGWSIKQLLPHLLKPTHPDTLSRYDKHEQLLYIPYLGKIMKRLMRMRGESGKRIFVWGNFVQLYHETGSPAADTYIHYCLGPWDDPLLEGYFDSMIGGIMRHKPVYIIKTYPDLDMDLLEKVTGLKYELVKVALNRYPIYRLAGETSAMKSPLTLPWITKMQIMEDLTQGEHVPGTDRTYITSGLWKKGIREARKLVRLNKRDVQGKIFLAELYGLMGMTAPSVNALKEILHDSPKQPKVRIMLAEQMIKQRNYEEADVLVGREIRLFGGGGENHYLRGLVFQGMGDHDEAAAHFEKARASLPDPPELLLSLAKSRLALGDNERARKLLLQTWETASHPKYAGFRTQAAVALAKMENGNQPNLETLIHYWRQDPQNGPLTYAKASVLEWSGRIEEARVIFQNLSEVAKPEPLKAAVWFRLARLSPIGEKETMLNQCLALDPNHSGAIKLLGELEECHVEA